MLCLTPGLQMMVWFLSEELAGGRFELQEPFSLAAYRLYTVVPRLVKFVDVLTNWYVRMNRRRLKVGISCCSPALAVPGNGIHGSSTRDHGFKCCHFVPESGTKVNCFLSSLFCGKNQPKCPIILLHLLVGIEQSNYSLENKCVALT